MFKLNLQMKILSVLNNLLKVNQNKHNLILHVHLQVVKLILLILLLARVAPVNLLRHLLFIIKLIHLLIKIFQILKKVLIPLKDKKVKNGLHQPSKNPINQVILYVAPLDVLNTSGLKNHKNLLQNIQLMENMALIQILKPLSKILKTLKNNLGIN